MAVGEDLVAVPYGIKDCRVWVLYQSERLLAAQYVTARMHSAVPLAFACNKLHYLPAWAHYTMPTMNYLRL